jgi:catechol 2,3-dioxygenase-like lactoylglutathione lyase family enzyme
MIFHHVGLNIAKYEETIAFYEKLGFKKQFEWEKGGLKSCFLDTGNGLFLEMHQSLNKISKNTSYLKHICIYTDSPDAVYRLAVESGGESIKEPYDAAPLILLNNKVIHARIAWVRSPNGEEIEILNWKGYAPDQYRSFN